MIQRIAIANFRSILGATLEFGQPLVALVGKNGAGKTNLLHAIHLAARVACGNTGTREIGLLGNNGHGTTLSLAFGLLGAEYTYTFTRHAPDRPGSRHVDEQLVRVSPARATLVARRDEEVRTDLHESPILISRRSGALKGLLQLLPAESELVQELSSVLRFLDSVRYYRLVDRVRDHEPAHPFVLESTYREWKKRSSDALALSDSIALRLIDMHQADQDRFDELMAILGPAGIGLLDSIVVKKAALPIADNGDTTDSSEAAYFLQFRPGSSIAGAGRQFQYSGLSAGTRRIIQLITYLIYDKSTVMLLEQPEDCIHPGLLRQVMDVLATYSDRSQLIITTHSARVVNLVPPEAIRVVSADKGATHVGVLTGDQLSEAHGYVATEGTLAEYLDTL